VREVRIDIRAATPFTTECLGGAVGNTGAGARVLVQRYGAANQLLREALESAAPACRKLRLPGALPRTPSPSTGFWTRWRAPASTAVVFTSAVRFTIYMRSRRKGPARSSPTS